MLLTLPVQTDESLVRAASHLRKFDQQKNVFAQIGCSVDLPKIHALYHYEERVKLFGTPDNFDTEYTEHQHIADAKHVYKRTNKVDPISQMVLHVQRRTALEMKYQYLDTLSNSQHISESVRYQYSLGSRAANCPVHIIHVERTYGFKDLEYCIRSYLHNCLFPEGEGKRHRVKKRNLPQLRNTQVFFQVSCIENV